MRFTKIVLLLILTAILHVDHSVFAASITLKPLYQDSTYDIFIKGSIEKGDFTEFKKTIERVHKSGGIVISVWLESRGGSVTEAIKIGRLIRKNYITTRAPWQYGPASGDRLYRVCEGGSVLGELVNEMSCTCASACFLIWAAGVRRSGNTLGLHRPYFPKEYFQGLTAADAKEKYNLMSREVRDYLTEMEIPNQIIEKMFEVTSNELSYLDDEDASSMEEVPFFEEWIIANCGGFTEEENAAYIEMLPINGTYNSEWTQNERAFYDYYKKKRKEIAECETVFIAMTQLQSVSKTQIRPKTKAEVSAETNQDAWPEHVNDLEKFAPQVLVNFAVQVLGHRLGSKAAHADLLD